MSATAAGSRCAASAISQPSHFGLKNLITGKSPCKMLFISQRYKHASSLVLGRPTSPCRLKHLQRLNHLLLFCLRSPVCHFNLPATRRRASKEAKIQRRTLTWLKFACLARLAKLLTRGSDLNKSYSSRLSGSAHCLLD